LAQYNFGHAWGDASGAPSSAPTATPGNIQGAPGQPGQGAFGKVPQVPDPFNTQKGAIGGNMGNLGSLYGLGNSLNTEIAHEAALPYQLNLPNYCAMTGQASNNILSLLKGQVPPDVLAQIGQMAAERGVATGSIGSPNSNAALLRALGQTSLGLQQQGETELTGAINRTPTGKQFDPTSFLVNPSQYQDSRYLANVLSSAPDPSAAGLAGLNAALSGLGAGSALGRYNPPASYTPTLGGGMPFNSGGGITPGFGQGGVPNPTGQGYASTTDTPFGPPNSFQPGDFESMGFFDDQSMDYGNSDAFNTDYMFG